MSPSTKRPRKTLADLFALPDETSAELIDGEITVTPSPSRAHQRIVVRLVHLLENHTETRADREVLAAPFDVYLPTGDVVQPDVICVAAPNPALRDDGLHAAPDLAIEILSPAHPLRDRVVKRDLYARSGVPEYWIVDFEDRSIEILRLEGGAYRAAGRVTADDEVRTRFLSGFVFRASDIF